MSWEEVAKEFGYIVRDPRYVMYGPKRMAEEIFKVRAERDELRAGIDVLKYASSGTVDMLTQERAEAQHIATILGSEVIKLRAELEVYTQHRSPEKRYCPNGCHKEIDALIAERDVRKQDVKKLTQLGLDTAVFADERYTKLRLAATAAYEALKKAELSNAEGINGLVRGFIGNAEVDFKVSQTVLKEAIKVLKSAGVGGVNCTWKRAAPTLEIKIEDPGDGGKPY